MSIQVVQQTALPITQHKVSPVPIGHTPGHPSNAINLRAHSLVQDIIEFVIRQARATTASLNLAL